MMHGKNVNLLEKNCKGEVAPNGIFLNSAQIIHKANDV